MGSINNYEEMLEIKTCMQLKGGLFPLTTLQLLTSDLVALEEQLNLKIQQAPNFFNNAPIVIDLYHLSEESLEQIDFVALKDILIKKNLVPVGVKNANQNLQKLAIEAFITMENDNHFLETAMVFGNYYGTSKQFVLKSLAEGKDVILEIDVQGAAKIKKHGSQLNCCSIFILPPSLQSLNERLNSRGQDDSLVIQQRVNNAKLEIKHYLNYNYLIINDNFEKAVQDLSTIIYAERLAVNKQKILHANLINSLLQ